MIFLCLEYHVKKGMNGLQIPILRKDKNEDAVFRFISIQGVCVCLFSTCDVDVDSRWSKTS